jgi:uncharacterized protein YodC (DUF2158 family)
MQFKVGDVVQLKSGGPFMTIESRSQQGGWMCIWFDGDAQKRAAFVEATLTKDDDE